MLIKNILNSIDKFKKSYKNYWFIMIEIIFKKKYINVILTDGTKHKWKIKNVFVFREYKNTNFINVSNLIQCFDGKETILKFKYKNYHIQLLDAVNNGAVSDVFAKEEYSWLAPNTYFLIDIGGNIADSAIYFALNGAQHIIAIEPYPYSYRTAIENIKLNNLVDKITFINAGYGKGKITVDANIKNDGSTPLNASENGIEVSLMSLQDIIVNHKLKVQDKLLLKMDCEGCEYNLLDEDNSILRKFKRIQIEYHYGHENLKNKLESAGFIVMYTPHDGISYERKRMKEGYLYAQLDDI